MKIIKLQIKNLRNHTDSILIPSSSINLISGENGSGKTTLLEALSISAFSKSFLPTNDSMLIRFNQDYYQINAEYESDLKTVEKIKIEFRQGSRKKISSNSEDNLSPKDIIGNIPLTILSPDYKSITFGSPENRREFIDKILSQISKVYLNELIKYKNILKQRNSLLNLGLKSRYFDYSQLEEWTNQLIISCSKIVKKRMEFSPAFASYFKFYYEKVSSSKENVDFKYLPFWVKDNSQVLITSEAEILEKIRNMYKELLVAERKRGLTLFGIQKDDYAIEINDAKAREVASQGQHKSLLISLKFAEFDYLYELRQEKPIFILDDIFSELDANRSKAVANLLADKNAQTFVTATDREFIISTFPRITKFKVDGGELFLD